jgi:hypothetical protein
MRNKQHLIPDLKQSCLLAAIAAAFCFSLSSAKTDVPVFLLSGQSNMAGMANVSELTADQKKAVDSVKIYLEAEGDNTKRGKWMTLGTGFGSTASQFGPELFLGRTLADSMPGKKIAFIKDAVSGTYLGKSSGGWLPPSSDGSTGTLYTAMMTNIDKAMKSFTTAYDTAKYTPRWAGFLWLQGEFDGWQTSDQQYADAYEANLTNLIKDIRAQVQVPDLPVILIMIDASSQWKLASTIRAADVAVRNKLTNVDTMDTKGFSTDGIHYKAAGQVKIGQISAQRWVKMRYNYGMVPIVYYPKPSMTQRQQFALSPSVALFDLSGRKIGGGITSWRAVTGSQGTTACLIAGSSAGAQRFLRLPQSAR